MALDGIFLSKVKNEIESNAIGMRVDRVNQPSKDEIVLNLRGRDGGRKLFISARADSARINFTSHQIENPPKAPMFCMLLRKHLSSAAIMGVRQLGLDRAIYIDFDATNEIGDKVKLTLAVEVMGKCSNIILIDGEGKIIDCIKRVDFSTSTVRQILPGIRYELPPSQNKLNIEGTSSIDVASAILQKGDKILSSAVLSTIEGISPVISREVVFRTVYDDQAVSELSNEERQKLESEIELLKQSLPDEKVYMLLTADNKPKDMAFIRPEQYGDMLKVKEYETASALLDDFYYERDRISRINHRAHELIKTLNLLSERTARKIALQKEELKRCEKKDDLKLFAELITANIYNLEKGALFYDVPNYYDNMKTVRIPCNPAFTPTQNANKYYKDYRKSKTAQSMLGGLIEKGEEEIVYLESVLDEISRADTDSELSAIRRELTEGGYVKNKNTKKQKPPKELPPIEFMSDDGYRILVGRNNIQNDKLSLKTADKNDMWLHTQGFPGSHVIIENKNGEVSDDSILQAAAIAACYSKAKDSSLVPVDYTVVKKLKKPVGAKPGKVIYHEYYTVIVKPDESLAKRLFVK